MRYYVIYGGAKLGHINMRYLLVAAENEDEAIEKAKKEYTLGGMYTKPLAWIEVYESFSKIVN